MSNTHLMRTLFILCLFLLTFGLLGCFETSKKDDPGDSGVDEDGSVSSANGDTVADLDRDTITTIDEGTDDDTDIVLDAGIDRDSESDACPIGAEGCPCTLGGGCDTGLLCYHGQCLNTAECPTDCGSDCAYFQCPCTPEEGCPGEGMVCVYGTCTNLPEGCDTAGCPCKTNTDCDSNHSCIDDYCETKK